MASRASTLQKSTSTPPKSDAIIAAMREAAEGAVPTPIGAGGRGRKPPKKAERTFGDYGDDEFRALTADDAYILVRINATSGEMSLRANRVDDGAVVINLAQIVAQGTATVIGALADGAARYAAIRQVTQPAPQQQAK